MKCIARTIRHLGRDVALKVLPTVFTTDREKLARFEREARTLATLNHPHIGAIYGLEEHDGTRILVLELVEGTTLADRLARGPLPLMEALGIAHHVAEALEAAHEKGIVHPPEAREHPASLPTASRRCWTSVSRNRWKRNVMQKARPQPSARHATARSSEPLHT